MAQASVSQRIVIGFIGYTSNDLFLGEMTRHWGHCIDRYVINYIILYYIISYYIVVHVHNDHIDK